MTVALICLDEMQYLGMKTDFNYHRIQGARMSGINPEMYIPLPTVVASCVRV